MTPNFSFLLENFRSLDVLPEKSILIAPARSQSIEGVCEALARHRERAERKREKARERERATTHPPTMNGLFLPKALGGLLGRFFGRVIQDNSAIGLWVVQRTPNFGSPHAQTRSSQRGRPCRHGTREYLISRMSEGGGDELSCGCMCCVLCSFVLVSE